MNAETFCEHFATFADAPEGIKKLRHLILQLAVQGKLTTRETTDHPVKDLRGEMESARQRMIGAGTIRHGDQFTPVSAEETPYSLPENWTWVRIGEVMHLINGKAFKPTDWLTSGLPIVRIQNLNNPDAPFNYAGEDVDDKVRLQNDDFLISWSGTPGTSFGAVIWDRGPAVLNQHIFRAILYGKAFIKPFLKLAVNARLDEMIAQAHGGVGLQHITKGKLERLSLPLAPLAEQSRIVAKVDQLLALCDELAARQAAQREKRQRLVGATLDRVVSTRNPAEFPTHAHRLRNHFDQLFDTPTTIPQLRQTILQLAVQGQLVPQDPNDEPANLLLERIENARRQRNPGLMHLPENGEIGFAGNREICCAPPYQFIEFSLKAKERNSGAIILYSCRSIQVTIAGRCRNSVAKSRDSSGTGALQVRRNRTAQAGQPATTTRPRRSQRESGGDATPDSSA